MGRTPFLLPGVLQALPPVADVAVLRDGQRFVVGIHPDEVLVARGEAALRALDELQRGWWAGLLPYDLGRVVEPWTTRIADDLGLPDLVLARFAVRLVIEGHQAWLEGDGPARGHLEAALRRARTGQPVARRIELGQWRSSLSQEEFERSVRAAQAFITAGDCYQVNLTRRLTCDQPADPIALFAALVQTNPAPHAALFRLGDVSVVSASPERFLRRTGRQVESRPIKGTGADATALAESPKDRAENVMIVDLTRNDLGRICEYGSVSVSNLCEVEAHPGLYHLVTTVRGTLRPGVRSGALIRAAFPPASITGAPKPRVMQIIEDLEPCRRGVYCGAVGWIDADQEALDLNVAIRTFLILDGRTHLGVGAGIIADSVPEHEWWETELKAARLLAVAGGQEPLRSGEHAETEWFGSSADHSAARPPGRGARAGVMGGGARRGRGRLPAGGGGRWA